jgi:hypothetical protein
VNYNGHAKQNNFKLCPAYLDHNHNLFALRFPIDYNLSITEQGYTTTTLDQEFFNNFVMIRDPKQKLISFAVRYVFFAEQSCPISLQQPYMEDNDLANCAISVPGSFNAGLWFRTTDYAVMLKQSCNQLAIKRGDVYNYLRVDTDEPVEFVRFDYTEELDRLQRDILQAKRFLGFKSPRLGYYYSLFKQSQYRKKIIDLIQANVLE